jgi:uncharacterized protein (DUF58 family)
LSKEVNRNKIKSFHLTQRFFIATGVVILFFALGFAFAIFEVLGFIAFLLLLAFSLTEIILLYIASPRLTATRHASKMMSLGDENPIQINIHNQSNLTYHLTLYDEIPYQFQMRDFKIELKMISGKSEVIGYSLRPTVRGEYHFGFLNAMTSTAIRLISRRILLAQPKMTPVYPSIIQMKKYELLAFARISNFEGIKKVRRIGHSYEFEKIRQYSQGDDVRSINWKATGRRNLIMVNQYEDERSQQIYSIIDKSRSMHMPFNGLSLLDYAINTSLVISNIALQKYDKTGLITFSNKIGTTLPSDRSELQLKKILQALYYEKPQAFEANYDLLYRAVKNVIRSRSLIFIYLNFESAYAMERALPILKKINHIHLLVVMIFENTELVQFSHSKPEFVSDIYAQTIAQKLLNDKKQIVSKLRKYGIQTILSKPEDLSINTVNKYLELKARGMI